MRAKTRPLGIFKITTCALKNRLLTFIVTREDKLMETFSKDDLNNLKKRRFVNQSSSSSYKITKGPHFTPEWFSQEDDITADLIAR